MLKLTDLPLELLRLITGNLSYSHLKIFSLVNKRCRAISEIRIFEIVKVRFTEYDLKKFTGFARSPLAANVRTLHYDASELFDPLIQNWEYFTSCIYTTQEYARDYSDFCWNLRGKDFTYKAIHSYFKGMARDQEEILKGRRDIRAFSENIPRLSGLKTIKLSFAGVKEDRLLWFSRRLFADNGETYSVHIEAVLKGMIAAKHNGLMLESVEVEGMSSHPTIDRGNLTGILQQGLAHVKKFKVVDSPGMLSLMSTISLPWLERFEVLDCWLVGSKLISFLEAQDGIIEHVEFQKISLSYGKIGHTSRCSYCVKTFWEMVSETGNTGKIEKLVIVRIA